MMDVTVNKKDLQEAVSALKGVIQNKTTIPILAHAKMTAESDGSLRVTGTDMDRETTVTVPAVVDGAGTTTADYARLAAVANKAPDGARIRLSPDDTDKVKANAGRTWAKIPALPSCDFPSFAARTYDTTFVLDAPTLHELLERTAFAMSTEEARYYLNGIYLHTHDGRLRAVATDGHRLALAEHTAPEGAELVDGIIVPSSTVRDLLNLTKKSDDRVTLRVGGTAIEAGTGRTTITSKLIDGTFPEYHRVIPEPRGTGATVPRAEMAAALDRLTAIVLERSTVIRIAPGDDGVTITGMHDEAEAHETVTASSLSTSERLGCNARYLMEIVQALGDADSVAIDWGDGVNPIRINDAHGGSARYVLMPCRV